MKYQLQATVRRQRTVWQIVVLASLLMMASGLARAQSGRQPKPDVQVQLTVTYEYPALSLPFLVALNRGLFDKYGVEVQPRKLTGERLNLATVDIVTGHGLNVLREGQLGTDIIRFTHPIAMTRDGEMTKGLLVKKSAGIKSWADFRGKTVVAGDYGILEWQERFGRSTNAGLVLGNLGGGLEAALAHSGLRAPGHVSVNVGDIASMTFPQDEAVHGLYGFALLVRKFQAQNPGEYFLFAKNLECEYLSNPYFVAATYINIRRTSSNREAVVKYLKAIDEAIDVIRGDSKSALSILPKYFPELKPEDALLVGVYQFYKSTEVLQRDALVKAAGGNGMSYLYHEGAANSAGLIDAVGNGDLAAVQALLNKGGDVNAKDNDGGTALIHAAEKGHIAIVQALLMKGADVNAKDNNGDTALIAAAAKSHTEIVQALLDKGADVNARPATGVTFLMLEAANGQTAIVQALLVKGVDVNAKDFKGNTALIYAAAQGHTDIVHALLGKGADVNAKRADGATALMVAAIKGQPAIVHALLDKGADVNAKRTDGTTALMFAARNGHTAVVELLKAAGAK